MEYQKMLLNQLALDFNTTPQALAAGENLFTRKTYDPQKRAYENGDALLNALCCGGAVVLSAADDRLLERLRQTYAQTEAAWFLEASNLHRLEALLSLFGQTVASYHQYYIPTGPSAVTVPAGIELVWLTEPELEQFRGDDRFDEALGFNPAWPDRLAVAAMEHGAMLALAGASEDSPTLWQIGINVLPQARRRGLGTLLTAALKNRLLERGILPFYGTGAAHILSQRTAIAAGFTPAWAELYTGPKA